MNKEIFKLLVRKITGEITEKEDNSISNIIENDTEIAKEYKRLEIIWADTGELKQSSNINSNYEITKRKILFIKKRRKKTIIKTSFQYAAAIAIFVISFAFLFTHTKTVLITNNTNAKKTVLLPDSSSITLAANSSLSYQKGVFSKFNREINFSGKGFFDIHKNPNKKFTIHYENFDIQVFGTQFNVDMQKEINTVVLVEGKIQINDFTLNKDTSFIMQPGDLIKYNSNTGKITLNPTNPKVYTFWLDDKINFENFTINELIEIFKIYFDKKLVFDDTTLKNKKIGGSAPTDDLSLIINAISFITNKEVIQSNDTIYFK